MEEMMEELKRGWKTAHQLRDLLVAKEERNNLSNNNNGNNKEALSSTMKQHSTTILHTFDNVIALLKIRQPLDPTISCFDSRNTRSKELTFNTTAPTDQDGYSWRKYGQKPIVNEKHPREYYRCANRDQGCQTTKHVQIISDNPTQYKITYQGKHTCRPLQPNNSHPDHFHLLDSVDSDSANMLSFKLINEPLKIPKQGLTGSHQHLPFNDDETKAGFKELEQTHVSQSRQFVVDDDGSGLRTSMDHTSRVEAGMAHGVSPSAGWSGPMASPNGLDVDYGYLLACCAEFETGFEDL